MCSLRFFLTQLACRHGDCFERASLLYLKVSLHMLLQDFGRGMCAVGDLFSDLSPARMLASLWFIANIPLTQAELDS